jgi:hypothetical protein
MIVHVYSNCYNEVKIIPYFLRHYETIADKIIIYDAFSDDGSRELLQSHPLVDLRDFHCPDLNDFEYRLLNNEIYKESRGVADWVMMPDMDEFLYSKYGLSSLLTQWLGNMVALKATGYQMVSNKFPSTKGQIYDEIKNGVDTLGLYYKSIIFNPFMDVVFSVGKHYIENFLPVVSCSELLLLHYKNLGLRYKLKNFHSLKNRLSQDNINNGLAIQYQIPKEDCIKEFKDCLKNCKGVIE